MKTLFDSFIDLVYTVYTTESSRGLGDVPVVWAGEPYQLAGSAVWEHEVSLRLKHALSLNTQSIYTRLEIPDFDDWLEKRVREQLVACEHLVGTYGPIGHSMYWPIATLLMRIHDELRYDFSHLLLRLE